MKFKIALDFKKNIFKTPALLFRLQNSLRL
jgi:hypothetical protein